MKTPNRKTQTDIKLAKELRSLSNEIKKLKSLEFVKIYKKPTRFFIFSFVHGLLVGFGSVIGATVIVAIFIYMLTQISFVPIVGGFVESVLKEINPSSNNSLETTQNLNYFYSPDLIKEGEDSFVSPVSAVVPEAEDTIESTTEQESIN